MKIFNYFTDDSDRRDFIYPFVLQIGFLLGIVFAYIVIIRDIVKKILKKKKRIAYEMCGEDETIKKLNEDVVNSNVLKANNMLVSLSPSSISEEDKKMSVKQTKKCQENKSPEKMYGVTSIAP